MNHFKAVPYGGLAAAVLLLSGCVTHTPMSESAMFRDPATQFTHDGSFGLGLASALSTAHSATNELIARDYAERVDEREADALRSGSVGLYVAFFDSEGRYAFSLTAGLPFGIDATAKLWGRNYLTAGYSLTGYSEVQSLSQVFVQHRAFNSRSVGAAVGLGFRHEVLTFSLLSETPLGSFESVRVGSVGVRGFTVLRTRGSTRAGLKIGGYTGYIPRLRRPVLSVTLTAGSF